MCCAGSHGFLHCLSLLYKQHALRRTPSLALGAFLFRIPPDLPVPGRKDQLVKRVPSRRSLEFPYSPPSQHSILPNRQTPVNRNGVMNQSELRSSNSKLECLGLCATQHLDVRRTERRWLACHQLPKGVKFTMVVRLPDRKLRAVPGSFCHENSIIAPAVVHSEVIPWKTS